MESWGHFPLARRRLFDLFERTKPAGLLLLSGDVHFSEISGDEVSQSTIEDNKQNRFRHAYGIGRHTRTTVCLCTSLSACMDERHPQIRVDISGTSVYAALLGGRGSTDNTDPAILLSLHELNSIRICLSVCLYVGPSCYF